MTYNVYYNDDYIAAEYSFDTTRKSGELSELLKEGASTADVVDPMPFQERTRVLIDHLHSSEYVNAVETGRPYELAESQGFGWDRGIPTMAVAHSAGLVAAVHDVLTGSNQVAGSLSSGLHHARRGRGVGFCTYNGLAVACCAASELGVERVLVLDLDAHCGGGTRSMTDPESVVQIDVSTVLFDVWAPVASDALLQAGRHDYLERVTEALALADRAGSFDLVLYNAGMDPANSGVGATELGQREAMVAEWAQARDLRLVYALAGGYSGPDITREQLVELHKRTVDAFG